MEGECLLTSIPCSVIILQTDANVASTSNSAQTKAKDLKKSSNRSTYDDRSVKRVMDGTGCSDATVAEHVWVV
jgi:OTU domain-containing protein 3